MLHIYILLYYSIKQLNLILGCTLSVSLPVPGYLGKTVRPANHFILVALIQIKHYEYLKKIIRVDDMGDVESVYTY